MSKIYQTLTIIFAAMLLSVVVGIRLFAHGGEDHGEGAVTNKQQIGNEGEIVISKETQFVLNLTTDLVKEINLPTTFRVNGIIHSLPDRTARIYTPFAGRAVVRKYYSLGGRVQKGELLFAVQQILTGSELLSLEQEIASSKKEYDEATRDLARKRSLQDIISIKDFEIAQIREESARTRYESLQSSNQNGTKSVNVYAPIAGYITSINLLNGTFVEPSTLLVEIIDYSKVWVEAQIYEKDIAFVDATTEAVVTSAASTGSFQGRFISRNNVIDPATNSFKVIFEVNNIHNGLPVNGTVDVELVQKNLQIVQAIPKEALMSRSGKFFVAVHTSPEAFRIAEVIKGTSSDNKFISIHTGVSVGERVVISNLTLFKQYLQ